MSIKTFVADGVANVASVLGSKLFKVVNNEQKRMRQKGLNKDTIGLILNEFIDVVSEGGGSAEPASIKMLQNEQELLLRRRARLGSDGFPPTGQQKDVVKNTLPKDDPNYQANVDKILAVIQKEFLTEVLTIEELRAFLRIVLANPGRPFRVIQKEGTNLETWSDAAAIRPTRVIQQRIILFSDENLQAAA